MPVRAISHDGLPAVELTTPALRLVAVHGFGPRLAWFGRPGGDNLLLWDDPAKPLYVRATPGKDWKLRGGHRLWIHGGDGADENEATYRNDDAAGTCDVRADGFTVTSALDPETRLRRSMAVRCLADDRLEVVNTISNEGDMLAGVGPWCLTCTVPGPHTRYVIPLGDGTEWDSTTLTIFRCWAGHGTRSFREEQFELTDDAYVLTPRGRETKRMVRAPRGVIAMTDPARAFTFAIRTAFDIDAPLPGTANIATYVGPGNFMVEMETMGPFVSLKPGRSAVHRQEWRLLGRAVEPTGAALLAALG
jgi:hypothetical protein